MEIKKRYVLPVSELTKTVAELAYSLYPEDAVGERKFYSLQRNNLLNKDGTPLFNVGQIKHEPELIDGFFEPFLKHA